MSNRNGKGFFKVLGKILKFLLLVIVKLGLYVPIFYVLLGVIIQFGFHRNLLDFSLGSIIYIAGFFASCMFSVLVTVWNIYYFFKNRKARKEKKAQEKLQKQQEQEQLIKEKKEDSELEYPLPPPLPEAEKIKEKKHFFSRKSKEQDVDTNTQKENLAEENVKVINNDTYLEDDSYSEEPSTQVINQYNIANRANLGQDNSILSQRDSQGTNNQYIGQKMPILNENKFRLDMSLENDLQEENKNQVSNIQEQHESYTHKLNILQTAIDDAFNQKESLDIGNDNQQTNIEQSNNVPPKKQLGMTEEEKQAFREELLQITGYPNKEKKEEPKIYTMENRPNCIVKEYSDRYVYYEHTDEGIKYIGEKRKNGN
ncbi:MAG: hypothetical protein K5765_02060 [Clostridia bacterium]|nr:hypothetical protein [Clostridia bacterium]